MRVILNPVARGGAGTAMRTEIERVLAPLGTRLSIVTTDRAGHATQLAAQAVADGVQVIVAAGGDGTIHEVANGILQATENVPSPTVAMGIIPIGTGNDFAKVVPGARTRGEAMQTLLHGTPRPFDAGLAEWGGHREYFLNAMGTGVDVEVVRQIRLLSRGTGAMVYVQGLLRALSVYQPLSLRISADGVVIPARVMLVAVANGSCVGGSFRICPAAKPDDGRLDLCIVEALPLLAQLALVPRIIRGTHESSSRVRTRRVREAILSTDPGVPLFFQLDGELREPAGIHEVRVTVMASRLQIIARDG